jgi:sortase A
VTLKDWNFRTQTVLHRPLEPTASFFAVGLFGTEDNSADRANSPIVAQTQAPDKTGPTQAEKEAKKKAEEEAAKKKAEEEAARKADEEAARRAEERAAAEQAAAEQAAAEQYAAEQAAAEQYAAEYDSWREAAAEREEPIPEQAIGTQGVVSEQPAAPTSSALSLTVPNAGVYNAPVTDSIAESVLAHGAGKLPGTGFPWQVGSNTYIAGHVYGYEGTGSWQLFAGLPNVGLGSEIYLTDASGTTYTYQVTETLVVAPTDVWVTQPIPGQTTVSLQTCTGPGWSQRMIVRGVLV